MPKIVPSPLVSVIIPCYNSERFLRECLNSVVGQTLRDIEIICVDDGSTDGTLDILNEYAEKDDRLRVLTQENQYAGVARNNGMDAASGDYLAFLDSDDFFEPVMLQKMHEKCEEDGADFCVCGAGEYDMVTGTTNQSNYRLNLQWLPETVPFSRHDIPDSIFSFCRPVPWNKLFRSDFIKKHGLRFQALQRSNDIYFTVTAAALAERITVCDQWLVTCRRRTSTSLTETVKGNSTDFYSAVKELRDGLTRLGIFSELEDSFKRYAAGPGKHILNRTKTKEDWLTAAFFLKDTYIPELGIWDDPKLRNDKTLSLIMRSSHAELRKYEPKLRTDETSKNDNDPAQDFPPNSLSGSLGQKPGSTEMSVIISLRNTAEGHADECIRSVMRQTLRNIEIICVCGDPAEPSARTAASLTEEDDRIIVIHEEPAENPPKDGRLGLLSQVPRGEYIQFLIGCDILPRYALERLYRIAKMHDLDDLLCESGSFYESIELYRENPQLIISERYKNNYPEPSAGKELLANMLRRGDYKGDIGPRVFRRDFLERNGLRYYAGIFHENEVFSLKSLSAADRAWVHKEPLYQRRISRNAAAPDGKTGKSWNHVYGYFLCLLEVESMLTREEPGFRATLEKLKALYKNKMTEAFHAIPGEQWLRFPEEMSYPNEMPLPLIISVFVKFAQREADLLKKEKTLKEIQKSRSWKFARALSAPARYFKKAVPALKKQLRSTILKSKILTRIAYGLKGAASRKN